MDGNPKFPRSLQQAIRYFSDPAVCQDFVAQMRWPDGKATCQRCGSLDAYYIKTRRIWQCKDCKRQFSVKIGTIFERSPIGLEKWLTAVWLLTSAKNGISSYELHRAIEVTQKTAWFMMHRIRLAMHTGSFEKMSGEVEVDETFIGGRARFMHKSRKARALALGKVVVMGLLERHGPKGHSRVRTTVVPNTRKYRLQSEVYNTVEDGTRVYSDELKSYDGLNGPYIHEVINHAETYVRDNVHTNGMENFWSLLKRSIKGTYVSIEPFHLFRYLDEHAFRFNTRKATDAERFKALASLLAGRRLTYKQLTGKVGYTPA